MAEERAPTLSSGRISEALPLIKGAVLSSAKFYFSNPVLEEIHVHVAC